MKELHTNVTITRRGDGVRLSLDTHEVFSDTHFTSVLFDSAVGLREIGEQLPGILSEIERKNRLRIETVIQITVNSGRGTLFLLRHTAPQKDNGQLM